MGLGQGVSRVVAFFRAGYPAGAPTVGYSPLLALLPRRVSDDELGLLAAKLIGARRRLLDRVDLGVEITRVTHELPLLDDLERLQGRLSALGRPGRRHDTPPV
ncbi:DUF3349 domain-containing protein [Mycobacterium shigaense]|uniref:Uncharacterized protein n=1 Tax=Mycobacterium shigaense TaxID=722731 RepID=A0A1Z4EEV1_9MYCO|nr:DUF3349 domain-containing protein [Mycobacterium shigaense]MEA1122044.1 DUF3349 domain-containing protein [Mycobacterium shigaense]PRI16247.1 hypothetical protein B2J96_05450 [Mycobacterium shigaense]BAX91482.1 hypothetical protein MSG_01324 [Mycobacterium shigaense]